MIIVQKACISSRYAPKIVSIFLGRSWMVLCHSMISDRIVIRSYTISHNKDHLSTYTNTSSCQTMYTYCWICNIDHNENTPNTAVMISKMVGSAFRADRITGTPIHQTATPKALPYRNMHDRITTTNAHTHDRHCDR